MANNNTMVIGKTKRSTDNMIDEAIAQQNSWLNRRRNFTRRFLKSINVFSRKEESEKETIVVTRERAPRDDNDKNKSVLREYWFPILCAFIVLFVAIWVIFVRVGTPQRVITLNANPVPVETVSNDTVKNISEPTDIPTFDIVRIRENGIVVAGRWQPNKNISILVNNKIVATERTDENGEFVYAPTNGLKPGNYTLSLMGAEPKMKSEDKVFLYISDADYRNSVSLLMTRDGSRVLQSPSILKDGDLVVSKIDYLDTGRIIVTGDALPRLRVSLSLNDKYLGFARVSDYKHFGVGADAGELKPGQEYNLTVRLHDGDGQTIATVNHNFVMPEMTGDNDTFYTVRRGDCLWNIARNFLRRGVLFSIIAERNSIQNPDLIFTDQLLQIPTKK
ncbi:MAG: LysM peptidoglycan-binding domain-containing protein [Alphaproteobacteria bacterium]|nr:LysM peptidoglycan-binding domain-containing protein [Alphaproteobacteria bacterium]